MPYKLARGNPTARASLVLIASIRPPNRTRAVTAELIHSPSREYAESGGLDVEYAEILRTRRTGGGAGQESRAAKRSMSAEVPEMMMRSWFETTVSAVA
ncbi:hypothetical protein GCM10009543_28860 [Leifsonia naganoensis]